MGLSETNRTTYLFLPQNVTRFTRNALGACHLGRESDNRQEYSFTPVNSAMTPEKAEAIKAHAEAIAALLYEEADPEQLTTLAGIEKTVRDSVLEHVTPHMGFF